MAELIDVACDICGQKYRRSEEEIGRKAKCRVCGTKFEVTKYIPPDELFEEEQAAALGNPMPWIKGGATFALILLLVGGLGSLLFITPASAKLTANGVPPQGVMNPAPVPPLRPAQQGVHGNDAGAVAARVPVAPLVPDKAAIQPATPKVEKSDAQASAIPHQPPRSADVDLSKDYQIVETNGTRSGVSSTPGSSSLERAHQDFPQSVMDPQRHLNEARKRHEEIQAKMKREMEEIRRRHGIKSP